MNPKPDKFDHLLDQALSNYTPAGARPHLEQRLQAAIQTALSTQPNVRFHQLRWVFVLPLAAAVLLVGVFTTLYFHTHSGETNRAGITKPPSPATPATHHERPSPTAQITLSKATSQSAVNRPGKRPTQPLVPSTTLRLTDQERQLFQLATRHPDAAQSILNLQADREKPLRGEPLKVKPIQIETLRWSAIPVQQLDIPPIEMATRQPPTQPSTF